MFERYPLFHSHIDLAHKHWRSLIKQGDTVIDATCGNGHDTLVLAQIALSSESGKLFACDVQKEAIDSAEQMLLGKLGRDIMSKIQFVQGCHSTFPKVIRPNSVKLVAYNLGYLPGGDKSRTTTAETTLTSIKNAQELILDGGLISVTCYPGHAEGKREEEKILDYSTTLDPKQWSCCSHRWSNRKNAPSLLLIQKRMK